MSARSPLAVRIVLGAVAALALLGAAWGAWNLRAAAAYDQATAVLRNVAQEAAASDADTSRLAQQARQAQDRLADVDGDILLLPGLRADIGTNLAAAQDLVRQLDAANASQDGADASGGTGTNGNGTAGGSTELSDEQRQRIEDMLKANQSASPSPDAGSNADTGQEGTPGTTSGEAKPW